MAVSEAFIEAGKLMARRHALKLVLLHAPALAAPDRSERFGQAVRGVNYARMLGRQHGFEDDVNTAIQLIPDLMRLNPQKRAADLAAMLVVIEPPAQRLEAAE